MSDLRALIENLEKLEEPDRAVDAEIDVALFGGETVWKTANYTMELYPASRRPSKHHVGGFANEHVPLVTASLDAAIALLGRVLPGWSWTIMAAKPIRGDRAGNTITEGPFTAIVNNAPFRPRQADIEHEGVGVNPAIALVLATLRALAAQEGK